jgi:cell division protein ZapA
MTRDAKLVQVEIFGQVYRLRAEDDAAYVESLASYVDGKMREVSRQTKAVDSLKVAVLAALNIADEHHRAMKSGKGAEDPGRRTGGGASKELERRSAALIQILDDALAG